MLHALQGQVLVPQILDYSDRCLTITFMTGIHEQELLDAGPADGVLRACDTMLWRIHQLGTGGIAALATAAGDGQVLVHGDHGPQNVLLDRPPWRSLRSWTGNGPTRDTRSRTSRGVKGSSACTIPAW
jgi:hypothetical protein